MNEDAIHLEPISRAWVDWTPDLIRIAERQAEAGSLRLAADLCEEILSDDRVQGVLPVRARGLLSLPLSFEDGIGPARQRRKAVKALEAQQDWWTMAPDAQLEAVNTWGILLGVCPVQKIWSRNTTTDRLVPTIDQWHPRNLRRDMKGQWHVLTQAGEIQIEQGASWSIYLPRGPKRWSAGAWKAVSRWWLLKRLAQSDWGDHGSRAAGIRIASPPAPVTGAVSDPSKREVSRQQLADTLRTMARNGSLVLPSGWSVSLVQAAANTYQTFQEQIAVANAGIAIALAGQNLTSEVKGGSYAAAQVHKSIGNVLLASDAESLTSWMHDGVMGEWAEYNLGSRDLAPWPDYDTRPPEDLKAIADTMLALAGAATAWNTLLASVGQTVDVEELARRGGVTMKPISDAKTPAKTDKNAAQDKTQQ